MTEETLKGSDVVKPDTLVEVDQLVVQFKTGQEVNTVVDGVSFNIERGETLALVGESGSGKTVTAMSILRLLPSPPAQWPSGEIRYDNRDMLTLNESALREMRGNSIGVIFQEPMMSLNPLHTVGKQIAEVLRKKELHVKHQTAVVEKTA